MKFRESLRIELGQKFSVKKVDPAFKGHHESGDAAKEEIVANAQRLAELQTILWAQKMHSVLIVLQAMDAGGKDGTISHVLGPLNPQGVTVTPFRVPTPEEAAHDFLWRIHPHTPARGYIAVFNRSHYEDVLAPRVHGVITKAVWERRYQRIRDFEQLLAENDTKVLKFFLQISREEQLQRFAERLDDPKRNWKISQSDYAERPHWDAYMLAYEDAINATTTSHAPWYVIPSNHKWFRNLAVSQIILDTLEEMKLGYPAPQVDLREIRRQYHEALKQEKPSPKERG